MNKKSDAEAAAERETKLHEEIERLKSGEAAQRSGGSETQPAPPMSPREFIQKRMRELDKKKS